MTAATFSGRVLQVEVQADPIDVGQVAIYTRHDDSPTFKPAQFVASFDTWDNATTAALHVARSHGVKVKFINQPGFAVQTMHFGPFPVVTGVQQQ